MLTFNRLLYRVGRRTFHPSFTAPRLAHTGRSPYTELPTSRNFSQPLSFGLVRHAHMIGKCPQEEKPSDVCTYAHNFTIDSEEDKVDTPDVKGEIMRSIAAKMGIPYPYLSKVTMAEAKRVVSKCTGYIYGTKNRTIVPFPVAYGKEVRWVYFLLLGGFRSTYLSAEASQALCLEPDGESAVTIAGRSSMVFRAPQDSAFRNVNILGTDFCDMNDAIVVGNYANHRAKVFFSELDPKDAVFELGDERAGG